MTTFKKATKKQAKLRMALIGLSGGGKTYTALTLASAIGGKVAVIDTERGSASKYSDLFDFDVLELESFSPDNYINGIRAAQEAGYDVLVIDSLSHAWTGKEGILEMHDKATMRQRTQNSYTAWRDVTPKHNELVDAILQANMHVFVTMRAKTEYVQEKNDKTGKTSIRKVGLAPVQRDGLEYEFDVVADMDQDNNMIVSKSRCVTLSGEVVNKPGKKVADTLKKWLSDGEPMMSDDQRNRIAELLMSEKIDRSEADSVNGNMNTFTEKRANDAIAWLESLITERSKSGKKVDELFDEAMSKETADLKGDLPIK